MSLFGIMLMLATPEKVPGILIFLFFGFFNAIYIRDWRNRKPQLIIARQDITNAKGKLFLWQDIKSLELKSESGRYQMLHYLEFTHPGGKERWNLDSFETDPYQIMYTINAYRYAGYTKKQIRHIYRQSLRT